MYLSFTVAHLFYSVCLVIFNPPSSSILFELSLFNIYDFKTARFMVRGLYWMTHTPQSWLPYVCLCSCSMYALHICPENDGSRFHQNGSICLPEYMVLVPGDWNLDAHSYVNLACCAVELFVHLAAVVLWWLDLLVNMMAFHLVWSLVHSFSYNFCFFLVVVLFLRQCTRYLPCSFIVYMKY